jgi:NDP-sugar pyrophosphorylase family protein
MNALLLAAGHGTRLGAATLRRPKILAAVAGRPLLAYQLDYLAANGVNTVAMNLHAHADQVEDFLGSYDSPVRVVTAREPVLSGTAGALRLFPDLFDGDAVVLYGDVLTDLPLRSLCETRRAGGAIASVAVYESSNLVGKGVAAVDGTRVTRFEEKPDPAPPRGLVNAGVCAVSRPLLEYVPDGHADLGHDVWPRVLAAGEHIAAFRTTGYVLDIGTPDALRRAECDLRTGMFSPLRPCV